MILLISVFLTDQRPNNRYDRYEIFKYALYSYRNIIFSHIYILVELDEIYKNKQSELTNYIHDTFNIDNNNIYISYEKRFTNQNEWTNFMNSRIYNNYDINELIFFCQNDDHIFIDFNMDILNEGIHLLNEEKNEHKTLFYSHFPEIIKMSGKLNNHTRINNYIRFNKSLLDSIQIFNLKYLYFLLVQYDWNGLSYKRIDSIPYDWNGSNNEFKQVIYVPLRELCRHFDGYEHVSIKEECPALILPSNTFKYDKDTLIKKMISVHNSPWTLNNNFIIPQEYTDINIKLHENINEYTLKIINSVNKEGFNKININIIFIITLVILFILIIITKNKYIKLSYLLLSLFIMYNKIYIK